MVEVINELDHHKPRRIRGKLAFKGNFPMSTVRIMRDNLLDTRRNLAAEVIMKMVEGEMMTLDTE